MKKRASFPVLCLACAVATAAPSIRPETVGGAIIFRATNPEDRAFSCSLAYSWSYEADGQIKAQQANARFRVPPLANGVEVVRLEGEFSKLSLDKWTLACS